jgi:hypothetical protein
MVEERLKKLVGQKEVGSAMGSSSPAIARYIDQSGRYNFFPVERNQPISEQQALLPDVGKVGAELQPIFESLSSFFGFQKENMRNQLEHVVFLVVNMQFRHKANGTCLFHRALSSIRAVETTMRLCQATILF